LGYKRSMATPKRKNEPADTRVGFNVPDEIAEEFELIKSSLDVSGAKLAEIATKFVVAKLQSGELVRLNDRLVPAKNGVPIIEEEAA
jgi:hypothetical protein